MYSYIVAKVKYINPAHADGRDMDSDDDETDMVSSIQELYFASDSIEKIFETLKIYPFGDDIDFETFNRNAKKTKERFDLLERLSKDDKEVFSEELGAYFEDGVAEYFIMLYAVPKR
jgi:hypothetical protein